VHREITPIWGRKKVVLRQTRRAVTPWGGVSVLGEFLGRIGFAERVREHLPVRLSSPNAMEPAQTWTAFLVSVLAGARRRAHAGMLRGDAALQQLGGIARFPTDDTIRNWFQRFSPGTVVRFFEPLWEWPMERWPERPEGYSLDLDSTVLERYGKPEGARRGYNPKKPGRASQHPLLAVWGEACFILHGWLGSGNCRSSRGVVEFLKEAWARLGARQRLRVVRADSGFFDQELLRFLEERGLPYLMVGRMRKWLRREAARVSEWERLDENYSTGEFRLQWLGWDRARRFVVVRERLREEKRSPGRRLLEAPGYTFRLLVTSCTGLPAELGRDYHQRADVEKRLEELPYDLAADDFCLRQFFATEAVFCSILMLFNLLSEFQRASGMKRYRQPATLRMQVFLCGAMAGRAGHRVVLHLSQAWGGLQQRNVLFENLLAYRQPTSTKLAGETVS